MFPARRWRAHLSTSFHWFSVLHNIRQHLQFFCNCSTVYYCQMPYVPGPVAKGVQCRKAPQQPPPVERQLAAQSSTRSLKAGGSTQYYIPQGSSCNKRTTDPGASPASPCLTSKTVLKTPSGGWSCTPLFLSVQKLQPSVDTDFLRLRHELAGCMTAPDYPGSKKNRVGKAPWRSFTLVPHSQDRINFPLIILGRLKNIEE